MRILVDSIPRTGRSIEATLELDWARDAAAAALELAPGTLSGTLAISPPQRGQVRVQVQVGASCEAVCHRCGEGFTLVVEAEHDLRFAPSADLRSEEEVELEAEELDLGWYDDGELDLAAVLQEAIALALPARYTCPDIEGCDDRTRALLEASKVRDDEGHPGFSVLKNLR